MKSNAREATLIKVSIGSALAFSLIGIIWGVLFNSQIILFDGFYSLITVFLSFISLYALHFIQHTDQKRFPFGKSAIEPIIGVLQSLVIIIICIYGGSTAIRDLLHGGRHVDLGADIIYTAASTIGCLVTYLILSRMNKSVLSTFSTIETRQWQLDTFLSAGILAGFLIGLVFSLTSRAFLLPYLDPAMVIIVSCVFLRVPLLLLVQNARELLDMPPDRSIQAIVETAVEEVKQRYRFAETFIRSAKVGRGLFIEIDFVVGAFTTVHTVYEFDVIRGELAQAFDQIPYEKWLTVSFTSDRKWAV